MNIKTNSFLGLQINHNIDRLVYFETTEDALSAFEREKQIKGWLRAKKISLIESVNPQWNDLSVEWFEKRDPSLRSG